MLIDINIRMEEMTEKNCMVEEKGSSYESAKLIKIGGTIPVSTVNVTYERGFSNGYSNKDIDKLVEKTKIVDCYHIYDRTITRTTKGEKFTLGAYKGYYMTTVEINGITSAGGWGESDDSEEIAKKVIKAYKEQ